MQNPLPRLPDALRLLALLWLMGWALYVTVWGDGLSFTVRDLTTTLGTLLIPATLAFVVAAGLESGPTTARDDTDATEDGQ